MLTEIGTTEPAENKWEYSFVARNFDSQLTERCGTKSFAHRKLWEKNVSLFGKSPRKKFSIFDIVNVTFSRKAEPLRSFCNYGNKIRLRNMCVVLVGCQNECQNLSRYNLFMCQIPYFNYFVWDRFCTFWFICNRERIHSVEESYLEGQAREAPCLQEIFRAESSFGVDWNMG